MAVLSPTPKTAFVDAAGEPLVGGKLYTYIAGTTTLQTTYTDSTATATNTNPIILDSRGEANVWLSGAIYKFVLKDADDALIWTVDNISAPTAAVSPVLSGNVTIDSNTPSPALQITQTGTGSAFKVQDSADPDVTPFLIDSSGNVGIGTATPVSALEIASPGVFTGAWAYLPSGTVMLFVQTSAPTGWTKSTTHDNKALRVVSGSASSGGSVAFTTAFASQAVAGTVGSTTLDVTQIPSHTHVMATRVKTNAAFNAGAQTYEMGQNTSDYSTTSTNTSQSTGGGGSHTHTFTGTAINLAVSYVDVIIATKD
jgi:hypothetical protein